MNPPFRNHQDIKHVNYAYELLAPGGILVAIMSEGTFFRETSLAKAFRAMHFMQTISNPSTFEKLPQDTFKESGANVNTRLVVIRK
jgi:16S rRNA G1207 methylase RsmC